MSSDDQESVGLKYDKGAIELSKEKRDENEEKCKEYHTSEKCLEDQTHCLWIKRASLYSYQSKAVQSIT